MDEKIESVIAILEDEVLKSEKPPAMVVLPPDVGQSILGNQGGFIRLAIASLNASQGENQEFTKQPWVCHEDCDWTIVGLSYDEEAHIHLPEKPTKWKQRRSKAIGLMALLSSVGCLSVGLITIIHWIYRLLKLL
jgi:hypothetical protein